MIKVIIFDFDGVLADSLEVGFETHIQFCQECGSTPFQDITDFKSRLLKSHVELYNELRVDVSQLGRESALFKDLLLNHNGGIGLIKNMDKIIPKLSQEYKLTIVSNNYREVIETILKKYNLLHHFSFITDFDDPGSKSERISQCLNQFQIQNHEAVFVGDMVHDIEAGKKSNVKTIILSTKHSWNNHDDLVRHNPDILINDPEQLFEVLENGK